MRRPSVAFKIALILVTLPVLHCQDFKKQVIYQVVTDRFFNGSMANDEPAESPGLFDPTHKNWQAYWGGDLAGIERKLSYIRGIGATAIWVSPIVNNEDKPCIVSGMLAPYHSYWARDFMNLEEHFADGGNSFAALDNLISAMHRRGMKIIVDQANNHSNPVNCGERGALYKGGTLVGVPSSDPSGLFHHNANISDFNDRYQVQYWTLADLADLNQENPTIDEYLKASASQLQHHHVDAFRLDAVKHVTWGWEYSFANTVFNNTPSFLFGEWMQTTTGDALYPDSVKFANRSGISLLDFPLNTAMRNVFGRDKPFSEIDAAINSENADFADPNDLITFFDSHDQPRLLNLNNNNRRRQDEAFAFLLTARGIPIILYGDEQYLFDPANDGNDPHNRVWMSSFDTSTKAYKLIGKLAALRGTNNAIAYGTSRQRWISNDVYIFERQFFDDIVVVAINKSDEVAVPITGLATSLPAGTYPDYLGGLAGGVSLSVAAGSDKEHPTSAMTLAPHSVSVWQRAERALKPEVGSIGPHVGQPGMKVTMAGEGFGNRPGSVLFGAAPATIQSWSDTSVVFSVPEVPSGTHAIRLKTSASALANDVSFTVLGGRLIPVTFTVKNGPRTQPGDFVFLTGNTTELGNWGTTFQSAAGPMLDPEYPNWFLNVAVPAGKTLEFKFIVLRSDGSVVWENGSNHSYTVPTSGTSGVSVDWQY